jgi:hypothetical protein
MTVASSMISKTRKALHAAFRGRHALRRAVFFLGAVGGLYFVTSAILAIAGAVPVAPVFLGADPDNYYVWQMLFAPPLVFVVWVLGSGLLLVLGKKGSRRSAVLVGTAPAWGCPLIIVWIPSAVEALFMALGMGQEEWVGILSEPGIWQTAYLTCYAAAAALAARGFILAARKIHAQSWPLAILTGTAAAAVALGAYALFIR